MTLAVVQRGLVYPDFYGAPISLTAGTLDAATEKFAMIGRIYIDGRPGSAKTLSTGTIQWRTSGVTFANGGTTIEIGIQDVASGAGPIAQPDGTFDVLTTLTGGGGGITANAWQTTTMNSGTKNITHGDLIAVVWDMTARGGADSVTVNTNNPGWQSLGGAIGLPNTNAFVSSAWQTTQTLGAGRTPNVIIAFDDGTLGWIDNSFPFSASGTESFTATSSPDERGMMFQVPWDCKVDALWALVGITDADSDFTLKLYSTPTSSLSQLASVAVEARNLSIVSGQQMVTVPLATEVSLDAGVNYGVSVLATGSTNTRLSAFTLGDTAHRVIYTGGTTLSKITREDSTGDFAAEGTAVTIYYMGTRISQIDDGAGSGGGGVTPLGNGLHPIGTGVGA